MPTARYVTEMSRPSTFNLDPADDDIKALAEASGLTPEETVSRAEKVIRPDMAECFESCREEEAKPYDGCIDTKYVDAFKTSKFAEIINADPAYTIHTHYDERGVQLLEVVDRGIAHMTFAIFDSHIALDPACYSALGDALEKCWLAYKATCSRGRFVYLHHLQVIDGLRGKGLGSKLMDFVFKIFLRSKTKTGLKDTIFNPDSIFLCANPHGFFPRTEDSDRLFRFYERHDFRRLAPTCTIMYHSPESKDD